MEKISIVVPIYKVEKYLEKCIESILKQTYKNLEIILVNDGSPDSCGEICEKYKQKDNRIIVIRQENKGLSGARNTGLSKATGKYICFIDSDDYISKNMIETLYNNLKLTNSDISICGFSQVGEDEIIEKSKQKGVLKIIDKETCLKKLLYHRYNIDIVTWNKLYKKELFNNIKFPEGKIYEDFATIPFLVDKANNICCTNQKLYYYVQRKGSINNNSNFNVKIYDLIENLKVMEDFVESKYSKIYKDIIPGILFFNIIAINQMIQFNKCDENKEYILEVQNKVNKYKKNIIFSNKLTITQKVKLVLLSNLNLYKKVLLIYKGRK